MKRVLMTTDAVGGVWTYALELACALTEHDLATTLAVIGPEPSAHKAAAARSIPGLDMHAGGFALEWMPDGWKDQDAAGRWLLDLERAVKPDVVHLNGFVHGCLPWNAPVVVAGHSCVCSWNEAVGGSFDAGWLERYRDVVTAGLHGADYVVAPTRAMLACLERHYGQVWHSAAIPNGRDPRRFRAAEKEPFVLTAGRLWDRAKNVELVRAAAEHLAWGVVTAGDLTVGTGGLSEEEIAATLSRASIFALPARYEPFGLMPLEAALSGCALVLGDIASLHEVWGDAAVYVDPDDADGLTECLSRLICDAAHLRDMAVRARQRARRYTPAAMVRRYLRVYHALTDGSPAWQLNDTAVA